MLTLAIRCTDICACNQLLYHHGLSSQLWRLRASDSPLSLNSNAYKLLKSDDANRGSINSSSFGRFRGWEVVSNDAEGGDRVRIEGDDEQRLDSMLEWMKVLQKPVILAIAICVLFSQEPNVAMAANGHAVGGGRSSSDIKFPALSRSYSASRSSIAIPASYAAPSLISGGSVGEIFLGPLFGLSLGRGGFFVTLVAGFLMLQLTTGFLTDGSTTELVAQAQKTSVLKLQVGLLGMARSLQSDLETLADGLGAPSARGMRKLLLETVQALIKQPDFCISAASLSEIKRTSAAGKDRFNELYLEETGKFDEESSIGINTLRRRIISRPRSDRFNEYIVVTLLAVAEGEVKLPLITGSADLMESLKRLGAIPEDQIVAVEVLWTPQDFNDSLSENELLRDYPLMIFL